MKEKVTLIVKFVDPKTLRIIAQDTKEFDGEQEARTFLREEMIEKGQIHMGVDVAYVKHADGRISN